MLSGERLKKVADRKVHALDLGNLRSARTWSRVVHGSAVLVSRRRLLAQGRSRHGRRRVLDAAVDGASDAARRREIEMSDKYILCKLASISPRPTRT